MTIRPLTRHEVRDLDRIAASEYGLPTLVLMENAGRNAAALLHNLLKPNSLVTIICGPGNNGGDGGVVARYLDIWGHRVQVLWCAPTEAILGDAAVQFRILNRSGISQSHWSTVNHQEMLTTLHGADWLVDGLLGTGLSRPVEGLFNDVIESINRSGRPILALDVPSGLDVDSGEPLGTAVKATITTTFVAKKRGFSTESAQKYLGDCQVIEIGLPKRMLELYLADHEEG